MRNSLESGAMSDLGRSIAEAIGEGVAMGAREALAGLGQEIGPLVEAVVAGLRADLVASLETMEPAEELAFAPVVKLCAEPDCSSPALARGLCQRHYARKLYQERKLRLGGGALTSRRRSELGGEQVIERKLAPVAPIIRRRGGAAAEAIAPVMAEPAPIVPFSPAAETSATVTALPTSPALPVPPAGSGVSVESVARFFGIKE